MSGREHTADAIAGDAHDRLTLAITAATAIGEHDSRAVCDAVEDVVVSAKEEGQPPERVLVVVKTLAYRVLDQLRLPIDHARAAIAWVVRCAVKAYYRDA